MPHRLFQADENRLADQIMADIQFRELGNGGDRLDVLVGQPVARMRLDPVLRGEGGHVGNALQFARGPLAIAGFEKAWAYSPVWNSTTGAP